MKKKSLLITVASSLLAITVLLFVLINWLKPTPQAETAPILPEVTAHTALVVDEFQNNNNPTAPKIIEKVGSTGIENIPNSLQGTEVDGEIIINENKQLVVTYGLRRLFDYFLSLMGEESIEQINARVENYIRSHTPEPAASRAVEIYYAYISYLQALSDIEKHYGQVQMQATQTGDMDLELIKQRRHDMQSLRQQFFDKETIEAFFAEEDNFEEYTVAMLELSNDTNLSEDEKQQQREEYISRMPDSEDKRALVQYRTQQQDLRTLLERTAELKKQGANAEALYHMRVELVGEPAAKRLAVVDDEEANFEKRFVQYQAQKQALITEFGVGSAGVQEKVDDIAQALFSATEINRLVGYEAVRNSQE